MHYRLGGLLTVLIHIKPIPERTKEQMGFVYPDQDRELSIFFVNCKYNIISDNKCHVSTQQGIKLSDVLYI